MKFKEQKINSTSEASRVARKVMENHLGRELSQTECVHHIDHNPQNNELENLHIFQSRSKHRKYHEFLKNLVRFAIDGLTSKERLKKQQREHYLRNRERILSKFKTHRGGYNVG